MEDYIIIYWVFEILFLLYVLRFLNLGIRYFERELGQDKDAKNKMPVFYFD